MSSRTAIVSMLFTIDPEDLPMAEGPISYPPEVLSKAAGREEEVSGLRGLSRRSSLRRRRGGAMVQLSRPSVGRARQMALLVGREER